MDQVRTIRAFSLEGDDEQLTNGIHSQCEILSKCPIIRFEAPQTLEHGTV